MTAYLDRAGSPIGRPPPASHRATSVHGPPPAWVEGTLRVLGTGGLGLWHMRPGAWRLRRLRQGQCPRCLHRHHRLLRLLAVLVGMQLLGLLGLIAYGLGAPACPPPAGSTAAETAAFNRPATSAVVSVRQGLTAGPTGIGLAYARTREAEICRVVADGILSARMDGGFARGGTTFGHVFITRPRPGADFADVASLNAHEVRHTEQWATFTVLGGPLAFPLAYSLDEALAPGAHNHFERAAGLDEGGYADPDGPSPAAGRALIAAALVGLVVFERHRFRRQLRLLALLAHQARRRRSGPPWWHALTTPVAAGRAQRLLGRLSPAAAAAVGEYRRLRQLGCGGCGETPAQPSRTGRDS